MKVPTTLKRSLAHKYNIPPNSPSKILKKKKKTIPLFQKQTRNSQKDESNHMLATPGD